MCRDIWSTFSFFVVIWRPFSKIFGLFRSKWEIKTLLIDVFATFILLTNVKLLSVIFDLLEPAQINLFNSTHCSGKSWRLYYDATVHYFGSHHKPYSIIATAVLFLFVLVPMILLMLYPFKSFQRQLNKCPFHWHILHTFMDSFQGYYKDGTEPGTRDCRWFASMFFLVQFLAFIIGVSTPTSLFFPLYSVLLVLLSILLITIQPFKANTSYKANINAHCPVVRAQVGSDIHQQFQQFQHRLKNWYFGDLWKQRRKQG